jgi:PKD repeat protein
MKKIIYLILLLPFFLISCEKSPEASFNINTHETAVGQEIIFNNTSNNAERFEWDFGDGFISNEVNPIHIFTITGTYEVVLTAISKNGSEDEAVMTLDIVQPSLLVIEVLEYYQQYPVKNASVILYPSLADWDNQQNMITEGFTDNDGIVVFADLDPIVHYVDVWEQNHDNYQLKTEDVGFITTSKITPQKIHWFVAWVDYVKHGKGEAKGTREMIIKKLERKHFDKDQPLTDSRSKTWEELYKMRAGQK